MRSTSPTPTTPHVKPETVVKTKKSISVTLETLGKHPNLTAIAASEDDLLVH